MRSKLPAPVYPMAPFEQYQELKADIVAICVNLVESEQAGREFAIKWHHDDLVRTVGHLKAVRAILLARPDTPD